MKILKGLKQIINYLNEKGAQSLENLTSAATAGAMMTAVVAVTGNAVVLDVQELAHVQNAQAMADAAKSIISMEDTGPNLGETLTITLEQMIDADKLAPAVDPSDQDERTYSDGQSKVLITNVIDSNVSTERSINKYFVVLSNNDGTYKYLNEFDRSNQDRIDSKSLERARVKIPKRDAAGWTSSNL